MRRLFRLRQTIELGDVGIDWLTGNSVIDRLPRGVQLPHEVKAALFSTSIPIDKRSTMQSMLAFTASPKGLGGTGCKVIRSKSRLRPTSSTRMRRSCPHHEHRQRAFNADASVLAGSHGASLSEPQGYFDLTSRFTTEPRSEDIRSRHNRGQPSATCVSRSHGQS